MKSDLCSQGRERRTASTVAVGLSSLTANREFPIKIAPYPPGSTERKWLQRRGPFRRTNDDAPTVTAISLLSGMLADLLHEGLGHGALALITGAQSGVLTTVAWSSAFDSKLVAAGGTLADLVAGIVFWIALRSFSFFRASPISATGQS
ncbi:MAG: hypothetical protein WCA20_22025 [Candidatus Sulfotelmatobacter sp.]